MKQVVFETKGTCAKVIKFTKDDDNKIHNLEFTGGCNGNLKALSRLCEGRDANEIADLLAGNTCGSKNTSCADQLAKALRS